MTCEQLSRSTASLIAWPIPRSLKDLQKHKQQERDLSIIHTMHCFAIGDEGPFWSPQKHRFQQHHHHSANRVMHILRKRRTALIATKNIYTYKHHYVIDDYALLPTLKAAARPS